MDALTVEPGYLSFAEAAKWSSLSIWTLRRMVDDGKLKVYRPSPGRMVLSRRELIAAIEGGANDGPE